MCGIHAVISASASCSISPVLEKCLRNRGPDHLGTVQARLEQGHSPLFLTFTSTVLSLRGDHVTKQPLVDDGAGSVLCWNGEAWRIGDEPVQGNDGEAILPLLAAASRACDAPDGVIDVLRSIRGPFAVVYFDKPRRRLYYARDRLGRRSLLVKHDDSFSLSSIAESPGAGWDEVEADGCYTIQLDHNGQAADFAPIRHDWTQDDTLVSSIGHFNAATPNTPFELTSQSPSVSQLRQKLTESCRPRLLDIPVPPNAPPADARVAVLFSGGLDCTVLARIASEMLPSDQAIDLINVAFENPRIAAQHLGKPDVDLYELCPDRITGRKSFAELLAVCPQRRWRFVTVNVPFATTSSHRSQVIDLIYPHNTEMDLSIAFALYFAARGEGFSQVNPDMETEPYSTTARVLISGLGADELFGGYVRHATAFSRQGYSGLVDELKLDVGRLGKRNLGRDDRVLAHWGREVRFPYLDESLAQWAIELPAWEKCDYENKEVDGHVEPGKRVLRLVAQELGMTGVSGEKKRAVSLTGGSDPDLSPEANGDGMVRFSLERGLPRWRVAESKERLSFHLDELLAADVDGRAGG